MDPNKPQILVAIPDNPEQGGGVRSNIAQQITSDRVEVIETGDISDALNTITHDAGNKIRVIIAGLFPEGLKELATILLITDGTRADIAFVHVFDKTQRRLSGRPLQAQDDEDHQILAPDHEFPYPVNIRHLRTLITSILDGTVTTQGAPRPPTDHLLTD